MNRRILTALSKAEILVSRALLSQQSVCSYMLWQDLGSLVITFKRKQVLWESGDLAPSKRVLPEILDTGYFLCTCHVLWVMKFDHELWFFSCIEAVAMKCCTGQNDTAAGSPGSSEQLASAGVVPEGVWKQGQHQCTNQCHLLDSSPLSSCKSPALVCSPQELLCCWHCSAGWAVLVPAGWPAPVLVCDWWPSLSWGTRLWHLQEFIPSPRLHDWAALGAPWRDSSAASSLGEIAAHCTLGWSWGLCSSRDANCTKRQV